MDELEFLLSKIGFEDKNIYNMYELLYKKGNSEVYMIDDEYSFDDNHDILDSFMFHTKNIDDMINFINNRYKHQLRKHKINNLLNVHD